MSSKSEIRAYRQHHRIPRSFDSAPNKTMRTFMALASGGAIVISALSLGGNRDSDPTPSEVKQISSCAQDGLGQVALNGIEVSHSDVIASVTTCESDLGITLSEPQFEQLVSTLEQQN